MTRFARATGSKASNERVAEEATSWQEMKQQMQEKKNEAEDNKKKKVADNVRQSNYKAFLEENQLQEMRNIKWADFSNQADNKVEASIKLEKNEPFIETDFKNEMPNRERNVKAKEENLKINSNNVLNGTKGVENDSFSNNIEHIATNKMVTTKKKLNIKKAKESFEYSGTTQLNVSSEELNTVKKSQDEVGESQHDQKVQLSKKEKNKQFLRPLKPVEEMTMAELKKLEKKKQRRQRQAEKRKKLREEKGKDHSAKSHNEGNVNKKQKNLKGQNHGNEKSTAVKKPKEQLTVQELKKIEKKKEKHLRQMEKRKKFREEKKQGEEDSKEENADKISNNYDHNNIQGKKRKLPKARDNKEHKRRKSSVAEKVTIKGMEVEIILLDGFPVKREDHERLLKLKKEMISRGIPRSIVQTTMKLERRKAEKSLTRDKKNVCYNCRKSGHVLSECPNLNVGGGHLQQTTGTGICFKCGSTEHTHLECKFVRNQEYKFATCFICKEQGHIAKQCPDNARGLYPKGGACKICGDVTHLKKDCPKFQVEQESNGLFAEKITYGNNIETLETDHKPRNIVKTKPNKIITF